MSHERYTCCGTSAMLESTCSRHGMPSSGARASRASNEKKRAVLAFRSRPNQTRDDAKYDSSSEASTHAAELRYLLESNDGGGLLWTAAFALQARLKGRGAVAGRPHPPVAIARYEAAIDELLRQPSLVQALPRNDQHTWLLCDGKRAELPRQRVRPLPCVFDGPLPELIAAEEPGSGERSRGTG